MKMCCVMVILCVYGEIKATYLMVELSNLWLYINIYIYLFSSSDLPLTKEAEKRMASKV